MSTIKTHFNTEPADYAAARDGHLERRRLALVAEALAGHAGQIERVLEVGSGAGTMLAQLGAGFPRLEFLGIDIAPNMVAYAQAQHQSAHVRFELLDLVSQPLPTTFDFAFGVDVLHHIHEPIPFLQALRRGLTAGAIWIAIEPNIYHPYIFLHQERMRRAGFDEDHFRPWRFEPAMRQAGFAITARHYAFFFPGWIKRVPPVLRRLEGGLERWPCTGGSVVYYLRAV